jgi:hypothetical protein
LQKKPKRPEPAGHTFEYKRVRFRASYLCRATSYDSRPAIENSFE